MDHLELRLSLGLALRLDDRSRARPREERLALARAVHPGSTAHAPNLRALSTATTIVAMQRSLAI